MAVDKMKNPERVSFGAYKLLYKKLGVMIRRVD
jgi:hypothetical protein